MPNGERVYYPTIFNSKVLHSNSSHYPWPLRHYYPKFEYMIESTSIVVLQVALRSVLFVPVNVTGQTPTGQASPFTSAFFKHYYNRLSRHLESKSELCSTMENSPRKSNCELLKSHMNCFQVLIHSDREILLSSNESHIGH